MYWEAMNFLYLGELALERGNFAGTLEYAETSIERFLQTPRRDYVYRAYAIAATATARMGDTEVALEWAEKAGEGTQQNIGYVHGHIATGVLWVLALLSLKQDGLLRLKRLLIRLLNAEENQKAIPGRVHC